MFSPLFDGQFRSKPTVSLRGASRVNEPSRRLVNKAHQLREERELLRKQTQSSIIIQSFVRGYLTRKIVFNQLRTHFDHSITQLPTADHTHLLSLTKRLFLFYNETKDHSRLVLVCQNWIKFKSLLLVDLAMPNNHTHPVMCRLLTLCLRSLQTDPAQSLAGCLRLVDVFVNSSSCPWQQETNPAHQIMKHCLNNKYFSTIRTLIERRVPSPDEDMPLTLPLLSELLQFIEKGTGIGEESVSYILNELLAPPLSSHLCYVIIPSLTNQIPHLLALLVYNASLEINSGTLEATPVLTYCLLTLNEQFFSIMSEDTLSSLVCITAQMFDRQIPSYISREISEEEREDEDFMMVQDPLGGTSSLITCIISKFHTAPLIKRLHDIGQSHNFSDVLLPALCGVCHHIINHLSLQSIVRSSLLTSLSLSSLLIRSIWNKINSLVIMKHFGPPVNALDQLSRGFPLPPSVGVALLQYLTTFSTLFLISLSSLHDTEVASLGPFSLRELVGVSLKLRDLFVVLHLEKHLPNKGVFKTTPTSDSMRPHPHEWSALANLICRLLRQLHSRNVRLRYLPDNEWASLSLIKVPPELFLEDIIEEENQSLMISQTAIKHAELLKKAPFIFPFTQRVTFFHRLIAHSRMSSQGTLQDFMIGPSVSITARRTHIYEDAFLELNMADLRQKLRVNLINLHGLDEPGIDGGGLFREFLSETLKTGYDPNRGYFVTSQEGLLYPNPQVHLISEDYMSHYRFLGGLLGKALYEHMLVELPFASFFLRKLTTPNKGWVETHYLSSLDSDLHRHLLSLKQYEGNIDELGLDFTTLSNEYGHTKLVELKPNGSNIPVTWNNRIEYIHLLAHHHLNVQLNRQFQAFRHGLHNVIPLLWLTLFNEQELQTLISGSQVSIDVDDLYKHTQYSGAYNADHSTIKLFWSVVREFDEKQKQLLLKFVTSCSRPPHLGFSELHPPFSILSARETAHLPSASTCMHLLKLPMFTDRETLREKLLYAISSGTGFELS